MNNSNQETPFQQFEALVKASINEARLKDSNLETLAEEIIEFAKKL